MKSDINHFNFYFKKAVNVFSLKQTCRQPFIFNIYDCLSTERELLVSFENRLRGGSSIEGRIENGNVDLERIIKYQYFCFAVLSHFGPIFLYIGNSRSKMYLPLVNFLIEAVFC